LTLKPASAVRRHTIGVDAVHRLVGEHAGFAEHRAEEGGLPFTRICVVWAADVGVGCGDQKNRCRTTIAERMGAAQGGVGRGHWLTDQIARGTGPKGQDKIARTVGRIENRYKLAKLFDITVAEDGFTFARNPARIAAEARLDGF
jgi:hypothetical protein